MRKSARHIISLVLAFSFICIIFPAGRGYSQESNIRRPANFAELMREIGKTYSHGGLAAKMRLRRDARMTSLNKGSAGVQLSTAVISFPVLLGTYSDTQEEYAMEEFESLLFGANPTGNMTDYYSEISFGQLDLRGDVYGWYKTPQTQSYYVGDNSGLGGTTKPFIEHLVAAADSAVDFSLYDSDGPDGIPNSGDDDGYVDAIIAIHTGGSASSSADNIWSHRSAISDYTTNDPAFNGGYIKVSDYAIQPEMRGSSNTGGPLVTIGVFCHETGHLLGLPDLYDRTDNSEGPDYNSSAGIGNWGLMASGSYGGDGQHSETPAHMSAWSKMQLGWITPTVITEDVTGLIIREAETYPEAYILWEDPYAHSRYFLIENRQQTGFDEYLTTGGLAIWHIDNNVVDQNDNEFHKLVDLEEADGKNQLDANSNRGDSGDLYPGSSNNRLFDSYSSPGSRDYDGNVTGVVIENISDSGPEMTCDITVRPIMGYTLTNGGWNFGMRFVSGWGSGTAGNRYGAVKFTVPEDGYVKGLWITNRYSNKNVRAFIYDEFIGNKLDSLIEDKEVHFDESGHYQVLFDDPPYFKAGEEFLGVVVYKDATYSVPFDRLTPITGNSYYYSSAMGNSIFTQWTDKNVVMRAMIRTEPERPFLTLRDTLKHDSDTDNYVFRYPYSSSLNYRHVEFFVEESGKIEKLYFYFARRTGKINPEIVILGDNAGQPGGLLFSQVIDSTQINTFDEGTGWTEIDLSSNDIHVLRGESFRVGYYDKRVSAGDSLHILADDGSIPTANSWEKTGAGWATLQSSTGTGYNLRIRALISRDVTPVEDDNSDIIAVPDEYALLNSYPNPFNNSVTIEYRIKKSGPVLIKVYNILGREVRTLISDSKISGAYMAVWDGKNSFGADLSSGIYFVVLRNSDIIISKKILLLR